VMSDITRSVPPHKGQTEISISNTRFKRSAQVSGAVTESCSIGEWAGIGVAVCVRFLRAGLAGPGTTAFAYRKFKPPFWWLDNAWSRLTGPDSASGVGPSYPIDIMIYSH